MKRKSTKGQDEWLHGNSSRRRRLCKCGAGGQDGFTLPALIRHHQIAHKVDWINYWTPIYPGAVYMEPTVKPEEEF